MCSTPGSGNYSSSHVSQSFTAHKEKTTSDGADWPPVQGGFPDSCTTTTGTACSPPITQFMDEPSHVGAVGCNHKFNYKAQKRGQRLCMDVLSILFSLPPPPPPLPLGSNHHPGTVAGHRLVKVATSCVTTSCTQRLSDSISQP